MIHQAKDTKKTRRESQNNLMATCVPYLYQSLLLNLNGRPIPHTWDIVQVLLISKTFKSLLIEVLFFLKMNSLPYLQSRLLIVLGRMILNEFLNYLMTREIIRSL